MCGSMDLRLHECLAKFMPQVQITYSEQQMLQHMYTFIVIVCVKYEGHRKKSVISVTLTDVDN